MQFLRRDITLLEPLKHLPERFDHQIRLVPAFPTNTMVLLGKVGQVQELVEGTGHRKQLIIAQLAQQIDQSLAGPAFLATVGLGSRPDFLNQLVAFLSGIPPYALAQKFTQHSYVLSEFGM